MKRHIQLYGFTAFLFLSMMGIVVLTTGCATERVHPQAINPSVKYKCHEMASGDTTVCEKYYEPREH